MSASHPRRLVVSAAGAACPMCGRAGDPTALFKDVYLCVTDGCRVWTFEAGSGADPAGASAVDEDRRDPPAR